MSKAIAFFVLLLAVAASAESILEFDEDHYKDPTVTGPAPAPAANIVARPFIQP
jgi:hypothetical protein